MSKKKLNRNFGVGTNRKSRICIIEVVKAVLIIELCTKVTLLHIYKTPTERSVI